MLAHSFSAGVGREPQALLRRESPAAEVERRVQRCVGMTPPARRFAGGFASYDGVLPPLPGLPAHLAAAAKAPALPVEPYVPDELLTAPPPRATASAQGKGGRKGKKRGRK